ncbi:MAG: hypothetical protein WBE26_18375, partial [Phycisphaerae bacterium]
MTLTVESRGGVPIRLTAERWAHIVDYIVKHTVAKLLEGKTPADLGSMLEQRKHRRASDQNRDRQEVDRT